MIKRIVYIVLGWSGAEQGVIGAAVPLLPRFPFLLLAAFCFAKSSRQRHTRFGSTRRYRKNLESDVRGKNSPYPGVAVPYPLFLLRDQDLCSGSGRINP